MSSLMQTQDLQAGQYYIPVFERLEPDESFNNDNLQRKYRIDSPFYQYLGDGEFATEDGDPLDDGFYDPELGLYVSEPDGFIQ